MPIKKPGPRLFRSVRLKTAKKQLTKKSGAVYDVSLNLTPMIDMFVVLVIFLLMTFSTSGEILFYQKTVELPQARKTEPLEQAPVVIIDSGQVVLGKFNVGRVAEIADDENFEIADLSEKLNELKKVFSQVHGNAEFPGKVIIQADRQISFRVLKKVMYTCTSAGYSNINFAVLPKTSREASKT